MYKAGIGNLELQGDHVDLSFRERERWPALTPKGSIRSLTFELGDPESGPSIQLGLVSHVDDEVLDWKHSIDPVHHHGSDQFRVTVDGEWNLAGKSTRAGDFTFQESGMVYQEHPGAGGSAWIVLMVADRRGLPAVLQFERDRTTIFEAGEEYGVPVTRGAPYPHPAGSKGIAAVTTTAGNCEWGYLRGSFATLDSGRGAAALTGLLGDERKGPVVHLLKAGPDQCLMPACQFGTELLFIVVRGSCTMGPDRYARGDLRLQRADCPTGVLTSGPDGAEVAVIVADRRARPTCVDGASVPAWMHDPEQLSGRLKPVPGGVRAPHH